MYRICKSCVANPQTGVVTGPEAPETPESARQMLDAISQDLADRNDVYQASSASLLAGSIEAERKPNLVESAAGDQVLRLRLSYDRAWVLVRQSLEAANVDIIDSDREQKYFNVRFSGVVDEDAPGFIGRLFGRGRDSGLPAQDFRINLLETGTTIDVVAESAESSAEATRLRAELLETINENLT